MYEIIPDEKKLLKNPWQDPRLPSRCQVACAELELDCCCYYPAQPAGRGPRLPSRREVACVELELDCCCHYPAGRGPRLPSRRQVACAELELDCCCYRDYHAGRCPRLTLEDWRGNRNFREENCIRLSFTLAPRLALRFLSLDSRIIAKFGYSNIFRSPKISSVWSLRVRLLKSEVSSVAAIGLRTLYSTGTSRGRRSPGVINRAVW